MVRVGVFVVTQKPHFGKGGGDYARGKGYVAYGTALLTFAPIAPPGAIPTRRSTITPPCVTTGRIARARYEGALAFGPYPR